MPANGSQSASQWLAQDDKQIRDLKKLFRISKMPHLEITLWDRKSQLKEAASPTHWALILTACETKEILWDALTFPECRLMLLDAQESIDRKAKNNQNRRLRAPPAVKKDLKLPKGKEDQKSPDPKKPAHDSKVKPPSVAPKVPSSALKPDTERWEAAEKQCPPGMDVNEHLRRSARGHMTCSKQNLEGGCTFGVDCQFRHTGEITAGQKYVMEVGLQGTVPSKVRMQKFADVEEFTPPAPVPILKKPTPPETAVPDDGADDDDADDDGFQVYRPKKSVFFDSRTKGTVRNPDPKGQYVVQKMDFATPLIDLTPESKKSEQDFRIRMLNKFEPNAEVANLIRSGAQVLPSGSTRSAKGVPAETWHQQRRSENVSAHPHVYLPQDMSSLMLLDVGPETIAALLDDDLEREDSVDLSSQEDEDFENILALKAKASGHKLLTDFFPRIQPPIDVVTNQNCDLDQELDDLMDQDVPDVFEMVVSERDQVDSNESDLEESEYSQLESDDSDWEESEYLISTNSDLMNLCGCSTIVGGTDTECTRCSQCPECCDCAAQHVRLLHEMHSEHPELMDISSVFDHFSRHEIEPYENEIEIQTPGKHITDVLHVVLDWIRFEWNQKKSDSHKGMSHFYFTHRLHRERVQKQYGSYVRFEISFRLDINRRLSTTSKTCISQQLEVANMWHDDVEFPFWNRKRNIENIGGPPCITLKLTDTSRCDPSELENPYCGCAAECWTTLESERERANLICDNCAHGGCWGCGGGCEGDNCSLPVDGHVSMKIDARTSESDFRVARRR
jgi:hypothetical protein